MRTFDFFRCKIKKSSLIIYISTIISAIILGIVLCKTTQINPYMQNYASEYLYFVYNFRNLSLIVPHIFYELIYCYAFFFVAYFTRLKFIVLPVLFLRTLLCSMYAVLIVSASAFGGVLVVVFVFIPSSLIAIFANVLVAELCRCIQRRYVFFFPAVVALAAVLCEFLLLNVLFRVVIAIV